ncbi:MAG: Asp-tRNA(Asn)/Glu-tRNA(Gln) amidotransferase subunit GatC [Hyphomicrobiales bacterium]
MPIDVTTVRKIAALARLRVEPADEDQTVRELGRILAYVEQIQDLDLSGIEPTSQVTEGAPSPLRADEVRPSTVRDEALEQAPEREEDYFRVPRVV